MFGGVLIPTPMMPVPGMRPRTFLSFFLPLFFFQISPGVLFGVLFALAVELIYVILSLIFFLIIELYLFFYWRETAATALANLSVITRHLFAIAIFHVKLARLLTGKLILGNVLGTVGRAVAFNCDRTLVVNLAVQ